MGSLVLIRHGQASLGAEDYDVLSELGVEQSRRLGGHLGRRGLAFDRIVAGPLRRHRDTADHMIAAAKEGGLDLPAPTIVDAFDEFPALDILRDGVDGLAARDPKIAALQARIGEAAGPTEFRRAFERLFQALMRHWIDGAFDDLVESYPSFQARVEAGTERLVDDAARGARIAVVSSAGPVGAVFRQAMNLSPWDGMRATFVVTNTSLSEFKHRPGELTLTRFNALPHLDDPSLVTLR